MRTFEKSREDDVPQIMDIIAQAQAYLAAQGINQWQNGYPDEAIVRQDIRLGNGYVLKEDGAVIGIATIIFDGEPSYADIHDGAWTTPEPYACIHRIAVSGHARGKGAADALMTAADDVIRVQGVKGVRIDTHRENIVMQRMLARNGYSLCGVIYLADSVEKGAERVALEKHLS